MRKAFRLICVLMLFAIATAAMCQSSSPYKAAQLLDVAAHQPPTSEKSYDLTVKMENTIFIVYFVPPDGTNLIESKKGQDFVARVDGDTMKVNDLLGQSHSLKILSRKPVQGK